MTTLRNLLFFQLVFTFSLFFSLHCRGKELRVEIPPTDSTIKIQINPNSPHQTIRQFGASDAWSCQYVGNWPDKKKNAIADLLFSRDTLADGSLKGIGLSLWRFNVGSGSYEQGETSGIHDEWRRTETFRKPDGTYDWNKQAGQLWFMKAAKERGVNEFLIFPNSPPTHLTVNRQARATDGQPNLKPEHFGDFANFLADIVNGIHKKTGIMFQYISPINEPQWDWSHGGQEGTPFLNDQVAPMIRAVSASLLKQKLPTQIAVAEASRIEYIYSGYERPERGMNVYAYFDKRSADYLGGLPNLAPVITGHSYLTTSPAPLAVTKRKELAAEVSKIPGLEYWMTEYCILGDNEGEIKGEGLDLSMTSALYMAKVIHHDLVVGQTSAWHWWLAISPYDYKDGLVYIDKNKTDGSFRTSKMLWSFGNFSTFIRPGAVRIGVSASSEHPDLLVSAYKNTGGEVVTVLINSGTAPVKVELDVPIGNFSSSKQYETSATRDLQPVPGPSQKNTFVIQPLSVSTITGRILMQ